MKVRMTISIDQGLYKIARLDTKNRSKYIEELVRQDMFEEHKDELVDRVLNSPGFDRAVRRIVTEKLGELQTGY